MLSVKNVSLSFKGQRILHEVSLTCLPKQVTALVGPSGCGKSTLLRTLIGLVQPDLGTVEIDGTPLSPENLLGVRRLIGYVIQEGGLFPHLTAYKNLVLMPQELGWKKAQIQQRVEELSQLTDIPKASLNRFPSELSGGQRQRLSLMRALMLDPKILLLDEPLGALDPIIRKDLQDDLREIFQRLGKTVILVTHDIGEAGFFGDQIVLMQGGKIIQKGTLSDLVYRPTNSFVTKFIHAQRSPLEGLH